MNSTHQKFRISACAAEFIKASGFSAPTAKLLFALIFLQDQTEESWPTSLEWDQELQRHFVFVSQLREICFPAKTGSSRFLRKPTKELAAVPGLFDHLDIASNGRSLSWQFSENFFEVMAAMDAYALIDASEISLCHRKFDGSLLAQIALHRKKRIPEFSLIAPSKGYSSSMASMQLPFVPSQVKRQLRPSLQSWANDTGFSFAVLFIQGGGQPGFTDVVIRIRHKATEWPKGRFSKRPPGSLAWSVVPESVNAS